LLPLNFLLITDSKIRIDVLGVYDLLLNEIIFFTARDVLKVSASRISVWLQLWLAFDPVLICSWTIVGLLCLLFHGWTSLHGELWPGRPMSSIQQFLVRHLVTKAGCPLDLLSHLLESHGQYDFAGLAGSTPVNDWPRELKWLAILGLLLPGLGLLELQGVELLNSL